MTYRKFFLLILLAAILPQSGQARTIDSDEARSIASRFFRASGIDNDSPQQVNPVTSGLSSRNPYYIFNASGGEGFVIVSGDDRLGTVLGYSDSGTFSLDGAPEGLVALMDLYSRYLTAGNNLQANEVSEAGTPAMDPLLGDIAWGQDTPFNTMCPTYTESGTTKNYYVGCVATAATQIMKFHQHPEKGTGSKSYTFGGKELSADFGNTTYRWADMPAAVPESPSSAQTNAYSTLASHFGIAVEMQYAKDGSGASSMDVPAALRDYFGYDESVCVHPRSYYDTSEWMELIKNELDNRRPVYYGASSDSGLGGHAFVCDGYDSNDFVHINWGWYGRSNGYFMVNALNPSSLGEGGGTGGYNRSQEIITGIRPSTGSSSRTYMLYGSTRLSFTDYGTAFTMMGFVDNLDSRTVTGTVSAILMKDGKVVASLGAESVTIDAYKGGHAGVKQVYMRNIPVEVSGVADGDGYILKMGVKPEGSDEWIIIRNPIGLPSYANASVSEGKVVIGDAHSPAPEVELLAPITTDGGVYANGSALFSLDLKNNSADYRINKITVRLTSVSDPARFYDMTAEANVYDLSEAQLNLLMEVPADIVPGEYDVTAFAAGFDSKPFDDSKTGRTRLTVNAEASGPVVRVTSGPEWANSDGLQQVAQGEYLYISAGARNYGAAGSSSIIARLKETGPEGRSYIFLQQDNTLQKGQQFNLTFYRKAAVSPGEYVVELTAIDDQGNETPLEGYAGDCKVTITDKALPDLEVVDFNLGDEVAKDTRGEYSLSLKALKKFTGTVYVRVRKYLNKSGELMYMGSQSINAGDTKTITFKYKPGASLTEGKYMVILETKANGISDNPMAGLEKYYRELTLTATSAVGDIAADGAGVSVSISGDMLSVESADAVTGISVYSMSGSLVARSAGPATELSLAGLPSGVYIVSVMTENDTTNIKIIK